jgi:hypothetical protein
VRVSVGGRAVSVGSKVSVGGVVGVDVMVGRNVAVGCLDETWEDGTSPVCSAGWAAEQPLRHIAIKIMSNISTYKRGNFSMFISRVFSLFGDSRNHTLKKAALAIKYNHDPLRFLS